MFIQKIIHFTLLNLHHTCAYTNKQAKVKKKNNKFSRDAQTHQMFSVKYYFLVLSFVSFYEIFNCTPERLILTGDFCSTNAN